MIMALSKQNNIFLQKKLYARIQTRHNTKIDS